MPFLKRARLEWYRVNPAFCLKNQGLEIVSKHRESSARDGWVRVKEDSSHGKEKDEDEEKGSDKEERSAKEENPGEEKKRDQIHREGHEDTSKRTSHGH
jgi:hypothetical protein